MSLLFYLYTGIIFLLLGGYALGQYLLWRNWRALPDPSPPPDYRPRTPVTILLPARNEAAVIEAILRDLLAQQYPESLREVIVIDDHSTDATAKKVAAFAEWGVRRLSLADYLQGRSVIAYKKAALEYGVAQSSGELILTTDADCRIPPDWLRTLVYAHETRQYNFITAPVRIAPVNNLLTAFQALDLAAFMLLTGATAHAGRPLLANGANLAFTRQLFDDIDGYAGLHGRASGDDVLLLHKVTTQGVGRVGFIHCASATVDTAPVPTWRRLWQQRLRWAAKTGGYADRLLVAIQGGIYLLCLSIVGGLLAGLLWDRNWLAVATFTWLAKAAIDFIQLRMLSQHFDRPLWMRWYLPVQLLYPFYLVAVGTVALFRPRVGWKGRGVR